MSRQHLKVAVAGFGKMGMLHSAILRHLPDVELCAVVEPQFALRYFAPRLIGGPRFYRDFQRMLDKEHPDAVYVTTPTGSHPALCEAALESGAALFVEKPLAATCEHAARTNDLATKLGVTTMVGYVKRFTHTYRHARELIANARIGTLESFTSSVYVEQVLSRGRGWRFRGGGGGGALTVLGCHLVDTLLWLFGDLDVISARAVKIYSDEVDDEFSARVRSSSGVEGTLEVSWSRRGFRLPETKISIEGSEGSMEITDDFVRTTRRDGSNDLIYKQQLIYGVPVDIGGPEFTVESQAFIDAVRSSAQTECSVQEGYRTQLAIDALYSAGSEIQRSPVT